LEDDSVVVDWRLNAARRRRGRWLLFTVHDGFDGSAPICARAVRIRSRKGRTRLVLDSPASDRLVVRMSAFSALRLRSDVATPPGPYSRHVPVNSSPSPREDWSPRVWKAFHRRLATELVRYGASSIEDLERRRFHVVELALDRTELTAAVDSARRHGLVAPLEHSVRADGTSSPLVEWAPTEDGRKLSQGPLRWATRAFTAVPPVLAVAVVSQVLWPLVKERRAIEIALVGIVVVQLACLAVLMIYRYASGAAPAAIAKRWSRHAIVLPIINRWYTDRQFVPAMVVMVAGIGATLAIEAAGLPSVLAGISFVVGIVGEMWFLTTFGMGIRDARREARTVRRRGMQEEET
jgi:hypothetical protein